MLLLFIYLLVRISSNTDIITIFIQFFQATIARHSAVSFYTCHYNNVILITICIVIPQAQYI